MNDVLRRAEFLPAEQTVTKPSKPVLRLLPEEKPKLPATKSAEILQLEATIRTLHDELRRCQRQLAHYELLLQNSHYREQELRAQLAQRQQKGRPSV
ncbi:MAG: hypothetical protein U0Y68_16905 [Blastocatellia bacterium]